MMALWTDCEITNASRYRTVSMHLINAVVVQ